MMEYNKNKFLSKLVVITIYQLLILPSIIFVFLSIPRIYATLSYSTYAKEFNGSYINSNINLSYLIIGLFIIINSISKKISKPILVIGINILFLIRAFDIAFISIYGFGYSEPIFANFDFDAILLGWKDYWLPFTSLIIFISIFSLLFSKIIEIQYPEKIGKKVILCFFTLMAVRSIYIINHERWRSYEDFASQNFVRQLERYFYKPKLIDYAKWDQKEKEVIKDLGINLKLPGKIKQSGNKKNLIIVYLESFQNNFVAPGGSPYNNLTPNLDKFVAENTFVTNFRSSIIGTINGVISSQCGLMTNLTSSELRENTSFSKNLLCISDILNSLGYYQTYFMGYSSGYAGMKYFFKNHFYDDIIDKNTIFKEYPKYSKRPDNWKGWGMKDTDLIDVFEKKVDNIKNKNKPFHISLFLNNTHSPYNNNPDCKNYSKDNKLINSINCADYAFGKFWDVLKNKELLKNTVVVLVGDHNSYFSKSTYPELYTGEYGKTFFAYYTPDQKSPENIKVNSYTPDVAPTVLELLGTNINSLYTGKSILSERLKYPHLVASEYDIYNNKMVRSNICANEEIENTILSESNKRLSACERKKIIWGINNWVNSLLIESASNKIASN